MVCVHFFATIDRSSTPDGSEERPDDHGELMALYSHGRVRSPSVLLIPAGFPSPIILYLLATVGDRLTDVMLRS